MPNELTVSMTTNSKESETIIKDFYRSIKLFDLQNTKQIIFESSHRNIKTIILFDSEKYISKVKNPYISEGFLYSQKDGIKHKIR